MHESGASSIRAEFLGVSIDALTMEQAISRCLHAIKNDTYLSIGVVNAAKLVKMRRDSDLHAAVTANELVLADGQSVVWASRILGVPLPERIAGVDLFQRLLAQAEQQGHGVYFLGARQDILDQMLIQVHSQFPGLVVAGSRNGYFDVRDERAVASEVRASGAKMLFLGMSSPKKELFLSNWGHTTGANVVHGVGGSFDVLAGLVRRAPVWYQEHGLEWLYRAKQEPLRLGRRYLTTNTVFVLMVARAAARNYRVLAAHNERGSS